MPSAEMSSTSHAALSACNFGRYGYNNGTARLRNATQLAVLLAEHQWADWCDAPCQEAAADVLAHRRHVDCPEHPLGTCAQTCFPLQNKGAYTWCASDCRMHTGCCAANCYCMPFLGTYFAMLLPVLVAPCLVKLARRRQPSIARASSLENRPLLLGILQQLGLVVIISGVAPTIIYHHLKFTKIPWNTRKSQGNPVHHFFAFVPLGFTLVLLSQRPSLANERSVRAIALFFILWAFAGIGMFTTLGVDRLTRERDGHVSIALGAAHVLLLLLLLPIVCRGALSKPTRHLAAWRLRHLWRVWRISMGVVGLWAFATLVIITIDPDMDGLNGNDPTGMEHLHLLAFLLQGIAFSALPQHKWRVRFQITAVRMRIKHRHLSSLEYAPQMDEIAHALANRVSRAASIDAVVSPLVGWPEQPPGLAAKLVIHPCIASPEDHGGGSPSGEAIVDKPINTNAMVLGRGGFSVVLRAEFDGVAVAVKVAHPSTRVEAIDMMDANKASAFREQVEEANLMLQADFHHPHLCRCIVLE